MNSNSQNPSNGLKNSLNQKLRTTFEAIFRFFLLFFRWQGILIKPLYLQIKKGLSKIGFLLHSFLNLDRKQREFPQLQQWKNFFQVLNSKEKIIFLSLASLFLISLLILSVHFYFTNTEIKPDYTGEYSEGLIGQPRFVNPLFSSVNDIDRDLCQLIFSGLFKYDNQGNIVPDLVADFEIKDDGKTYELQLKENVKWHDGTAFTSDDVLFTIKSIQDPKIQSPQRINWQGVDVEKIDKFRIKFTIANSYAPFLENLTVQILPKHIWENVLPQNFILAEFNLKPIGTGHFKFKEYKKDKFGFIQSYTLEAFNKHFEKEPYLRKIKFFFFEHEEENLKSLQKREILGMATITPHNLSSLDKKAFNIHTLFMPRYFAIFFNQSQSQSLSNENIRIALAYAIDKKEILKKALKNYGEIMESAIPPGLKESTESIKVFDFSPEHAKEILEANGWQDLNQDGWREKIISTRKQIGTRWLTEKEEVPLEITLTTVNTPPLDEISQIIKEQWEKIGVKVNIEILAPANIQQERIRPREYQALLFGEVLGMIPDPFSFWHSSQKKDPGLNLALYDNKEMDKILEEARQSLDSEFRIEKYQKFQEVLAEYIPAIFLYSPHYLYPVHKSIKGVEIQKIAEPSKRFVGIENWYVQTKRSWK